MIATLVALIALSCTTTTAAGGTNRTVQVDGKDVPAEQVAKDLVDDANVAARNHHDSDAKQMFTRVTTEFSDTSSFGAASVGLAHLQMDGGDPKSAQATLEKLLLQDPTTPAADEARYLLALAQLQQGDSRSAAPTLKSLVDKMPEAEKADGLSKLGHQLYAQSASSGGAGTEAARYLSRAIAAGAADRAQCEKELFTAVDGMIPFADLRVLLETEAKPNTMFDELLTMKLARVHLHLRDYASSNDMVQRYLQRYPSGRFAKVALALRDQLAARVVVDAKVVGVLLPLTGEYSAYGKRALSAVKLGFGLPVKAEEKPPEPELDPATGMPIKKDDDDEQPKPPPKKASLEETLRSPSGITIIVRDTAGDANRASAEVKELVDKNHAIAILGDILLDTSLPAALAAEDAGVPMLSLSRRDGVPEAGPWTFRLALTAKKQAQALASLAVDGIGLKHFAIVYPKYAFGVELMNSMWDELEKRQVEVTAVESYAVDQTTFTQEAKALVGRGMTYSSDVTDCRRDAQNITNAYRRGKALEGCNDLARPVVDFEALFIPDSYKNVSYVVPALVAEDVLLTNERHVVDNYKKTTQNKDIKPVQLLGVNMWNDPELTKRFGKHEIDGAIFVDGFDVNSGEPRVQKFVQSFATAHSGRPQLVEAQAFDGASLFNAIMTGAAGETPKSREQMRQALQGVKEFPGVTGNISFDAQGDSATVPRFFQVEGDRIEAKDPAVLAKQENAG